MNMYNVGAEDVFSNHRSSPGVMQHFSSGLKDIDPANWVNTSQLEEKLYLKIRKFGKDFYGFTSDTLADWQNPHMVMLDNGWSETIGGVKSDAFEFSTSWSSEFAVQLLMKSPSAAFCIRFFSLLGDFRWFSIASEVVMSRFLFASWSVRPSDDWWRQKIDKHVKLFDLKDTTKNFRLFKLEQQWFLTCQCVI